MKSSMMSHLMGMSKAMQKTEKREYSKKGLSPRAQAQHERAEYGPGGEDKHPGFKAVQSKIASKQGISNRAAGAILAASSRKASASAKRRNPNLRRVK